MSNRLFRNCNCRQNPITLLVLLVCFLSLLAGERFARAESPLPEEKNWHLLIEPTFMHPPVAFPIAGAERTVFVPGYLDNGVPAYLTKDEFAQIHQSFEQFLEKSLANASDKKVTARFVRNSKQVIEYAALESESPLMATAVLAPDFVEKFKSVLGDKLIVAIPNRNTLFLFPALTTDYRHYADIVLAAYNNSSQPVSVEAFELTKTGLRAIGIYEQ